MLAITQSGVVPIGGSVYGATTAGALQVDIPEPASAERAAIAPPASQVGGPEFRTRTLAILEMWLTVEVAAVRFTTDGTTPTAAAGGGHIINVTNAPVVFIGERLIRLLQFINATAASGALISYSFFFQESV
jgi:hypothetical protein